MAWLTETKRTNKKTGKKETYFAIQWREESGKVRTKALGFLPKSEATRYLKMFEGKLAAGEDVEPPSSAPGSTEVEAKASAAPVMTLGRYLDTVYLDVVERDRSKRTAESARSAAKAVKKRLGDLPIAEVDYAALDQYISARRAEGRKTRTVAIEVWLVKGCLEHAEACKVIPLMPRLPRVKGRDAKPHRFLSPEESKRLLSALKPFDEQPHVVTRGKPPINRDRLTYLAVLMALNLGMRKREILTRRWEDVRWKQGRHGALLIAAQDAAGFEVKTRKNRTVPLTPELRAELEKAHAEAGTPTAGWIFPARGDKEGPRQDFGIALRRACQRAGVPVVGPHALRHTWASRLAMAGVDRKALMDLGGWSSGQMLDQVYAHVTSDHLEEVMARSGLGLPEKDEEDKTR